MYTKVLLGASAIFMAIPGLLAIFMPQETLAHYDASQDEFPAMVLQIAGSLYLGFALLNWMARSSRIGGIYNRPIAIGNFLHFLMAALLLIKSLGADQSLELIIGTSLYAVFAIGFGLVLFRRYPLTEE